MANLSNEKLLHVLQRSLPGCKVEGVEGSVRPALVTLPEGAAFRVYLWTATPDNSRYGRPLGEHKIQIILPGTPRGSRQYFGLNSSSTGVLLGYSPMFGVFAVWELLGHDGASYSKNVQMPEELLMSASEDGWAVAPPRPLRGARAEEVRCAVHPAHLRQMLQAVSNADILNLSGKARQTFFESSAPEFADSRPQSDPNELESITKTRGLVQQQRLQRDRKFSGKVLPLFNYSCAVCVTQLNVIEAAHIIPVHDGRSSDDPDNGIALCRNHHRLYDTRILLIDGDTTVSSDEETIRILQASNRDLGLEGLLQPYIGKPLHILPRPTDDPNFQAKWRANLREFFNS